MKKRLFSLLTSLVMVISLFSILPTMSVGASDRYPTVEEYSSFDMDVYVAGLMTSNTPINYSILYRLNDIDFPATIMKNAMESNKTFMGALGAWETLTFKPGDMANDIVNQIGYYEAIILSVLKVSAESDYVKNTLDNKYISNAKQLYSTFAETLKGTYGITDIAGKSFADIKKDASKGAFKTSFEKTFPAVKNINKFVEVFNLFVDSGEAIEESINNLCAYLSCYQMSDYMKQFVLDLYNNCNGTTDPYMKQALNMIKQATESEILAYNAATFDLASKGFGIVFEKVVDDMFDAIISADPLGQALLIGQAIGKNVSNFLFSTDATCEHYYKICTMTDFEILLKNTIRNEMSGFVNNKTNFNANVLFSSIDALYVLYDLSCGYAKKYADIIYSESLVGPFLNDQYHYNEYLELVEDLRAQNNTWYSFTIQKSYLDYLSGDYPDIYEALIDEMDKNSYKYHTLSDGSLSITDYTGIATKLSVPKTINGKMVTSIGNMAFANCDNLTSVKIPDSVTSIGDKVFYSCDRLTGVTIGNSVTSIGKNSFWGCDSLASITIPDSVTSIGGGAFYNCSSLKNIKLSENIKTLGWDDYGYGFFEGCTSLISASIPNSVVSIENRAFCDCNSLKSITIGNSVKSIGDNAFSGCDSLENMYFNGTADDWAKITFDGYSSNPMYYAEKEYFNNELITDVVLSGEITTVNDYAFYSCDSLTSITIGNSVTSIGESVFAHCDSLTSITIGNNVSSFDEYAFYGCDNIIDITVDSNNNSYSTKDGVLFNKEKTKLIQYPVGNKRTNYTIPNTVKTIRDYAFENSNNLIGVTIPDSVTYVGAWAFIECNNLKNLKIGNNVKSVECAFQFCESLESITIPNSVTNILGAFYECTSLKSVTIGNNVENSMGAFWGCSNLTNAIISDGVKNVGDDAFYGCSNLLSVIMPDSITEIGWNAFYNCSSLTSITIPESVTSIGDDAFYGCDSLTSITIPDSVTSIGDDAFSDCDNLTIKCYENSTAHQYAIDNYILYELLPDKTQLEGKVYCQFKDNNTMMRFIAEVDIEDVTNANSGEITVSYNEEVLEVKSITGAYKSLYAAGQVITAPEGKCFIITNQYTGFMYDDMMSVEFALDNYDLGLSRDVIIE